MLLLKPVNKCFKAGLRVRIQQPDGIPQLMLLCKAVTLVAGVRQILLPELGITATIDLSVDILIAYLTEKGCHRMTSFVPRAVVTVSVAIVSCYK